MKACKKFFVATVIAAAAAVAVCAADVKVKVSGFIVTDESGKNSRQEEVSSYFLKGLKKSYFDGLLEFESTGDDVIVSNYEALKYSKNSDCDFIVFGFVTENDRSLSLEARLFDCGRSRVSKIFYSQDSMDEVERLSDVCAEHLVQFFCNELRIEGEYFKKESVMMRLSVPVNAGGFVFLQEDWDSHFNGIFCAETGLEIKPPFMGTFVNNKEIFFSTGMLVDFRYSTGDEQYYPGHLFSGDFSIPLKVNFEVAKNSYLFLGVSSVYEMNVLYILQKYLEPEVIMQNDFGIGVSAGYNYRCGKLITFNAEMKGDMFFGRDKPFELSVLAGISLNCFEKEAK